MVNKTSRILGIIVLILGFLFLLPRTKAQNVMQRGNTFIQIVDSTHRTAKEPIKTEYIFIDANGKEHPVYLSSTGKAFIKKVSKKTNKEYRQYLPEVTKRLNTKKQ